MILGEIFSDYTPAQVVVKELRASAGPLEQRKFIAEAQPYRYRPLLVLLGVRTKWLGMLRKGGSSNLALGSLPGLVEPFLLQQSQELSRGGVGTEPRSPHLEVY